VLSILEHEVVHVPGTRRPKVTRTAALCFGHTGEERGTAERCLQVSAPVSSSEDSCVALLHLACSLKMILWEDPEALSHSHVGVRSHSHEALPPEARSSSVW